MRPVLANTKKVYQWGDGDIRWPLVETEDLFVTEETLVPGCSEKHNYCSQAAQCFYMLVARAVMQFAEGQTVKIDTGMALYIPPETRHAIVCQTDEAIRFLMIFLPSLRSDRYEVEQDK